jgi:hypothetical protein
MKLLHVTLQFQYAEEIEGLLAERGVVDLVRHPRVAGRDRDGRHDGSQAFPGHMAAIQAFVPEGQVAPLLEDLRAFRDAKPAHAHLRAAVLSVDETL